MQFNTSIAGIALATPICNASGVMCTTDEQLSQLAFDPTIGGIFTKSCTIEKRVGNPYPRYFAATASSPSINSMGLPNAGIDYYIESAKRFGHIKPVFLSVAGLTLQENMDIIKRIDENDNSMISGIELNLSCPNVPGKPQIAYDFDAIDETLRRVFEIHHSSKLPLGVKLPPYFDPIHFEHVADLLKQHPVKWVTCINSVGNGLVIDPIHETTVIFPKSGLGGLGGAAIKATALANVYAFRRLLPFGIDVIGCGGITRGMDIFEHILCGAQAVQIGTLMQDQGLSAVQKCLTEFNHIMTLKKYTSLDDFRGKLNVVEQQTEIDAARDPSCYFEVRSRKNIFP